jgi:hypothetical protein
MHDYAVTGTARKAVAKKQPVGQRKSKRFMVKNAGVRMHKPGLLKFLTKPPGQVSLVNLSSTGAQLMVTRLLKAGSLYRINLSVPGTPKPLDIRASVVWCSIYKTFFNRTYYRVGFRFVDVDHEATHRIKKLEAAA